MKTTNQKRLSAIIPVSFILIIIILIKVASLYPSWIERNYSRGIYPAISWFYRTLFGWIPFSIGDILYLVAGLFLLWNAIKFIKILIIREFRSVNFRKFLLKGFFLLSAIYIYFNIAWGLNYNRPGIAAQLQLNPREYNENDLKWITDVLLKKVNAKRLSLGSGTLKYKPYPTVFSQAQSAYQASAPGFPFLEYNTKSIKRSLYGRMGNYLGFLGYYNPFTGEAQLNLTMPPFLIPYVTCHEMAHQLGYASESEANFVGYLAAIHSPDSLFLYSTYFDLFNYANGELFYRDSLAAKSNYKQLDTLVKTDVAELKNYWKNNENAIEPIIKIFYDHFDKANQQTEGVKSYNQVIGWLIAYYKKYGKI